MGHQAGCPDRHSIGVFQVWHSAWTAWAPSKRPASEPGRRRDDIVTVVSKIAVVGMRVPAMTDARIAIVVFRWIGLMRMALDR